MYVRMTAWTVRPRYVRAYVRWWQKWNEWMREKTLKLFLGEDFALLLFLHYCERSFVAQSIYVHTRCTQLLHCQFARYLACHPALVSESAPQTAEAPVAQTVEATQSAANTKSTWWNLAFTAAAANKTSIAFPVLACCVNWKWTATVASFWLAAAMQTLENGGGWLGTADSGSGCRVVS